MGIGLLASNFGEAHRSDELGIDEAAQGNPEGESMDMSIVWAPYEYLERRFEEEEQ